MQKNEELNIIKSLVGESITQENLKFIDAFVSPSLSLFVPIGGSCGYAVTPDHQHPAYMFVMAYDSQTEVVIGTKSIQSRPNTLFCLSPDIKHHEVQSYLPPKYCAIFIEKVLFEREMLCYQSELLSFEGVLVEMQSTRVDVLIRDFMQESQNSSTSQERVLESIATLLCHEIIRNVVSYDAPKMQVTQSMLINKVVHFINTAYEQEITVDDLARLSNLSKSHLTKRFSDAMEMSPMVYLQTIRLQNAKKMLQSRALSVTEVARQCGFNSTSYFSKIFKKHFLETPKAYMERFV